PGGGADHQCRCAQPHLVVAARCGGGVRGAGDRASPLEPGRPRAVPPHLCAGAGDQGSGGRLRRPRVRARGRRRRTATEGSFMKTLPPISVAGRLDALRARFEGFDALVVTTLPNVRYLSGFAGSAGLLVVTPQGALLTTDGRYRTQSAEQVRASGAEVEITIGSMTDQRQAVTDFLSASPRVGLEADNVSWAGQRVWASLLS